MNFTKKKKYKLTNNRKHKTMIAMGFPGEIIYNYKESLVSVEVNPRNNAFPGAIFDNPNGDAYDEAVEYAFREALKWYLRKVVT